jgi:hypothetical protein
LLELAKNDFDRKVLAFLSADTAISRAIVTTPNVPRERVEALRRAFDATMKDKAFLAEAAEARMEIVPGTGEVAQQVAQSIIEPTRPSSRAPVICGEHRRQVIIGPWKSAAASPQRAVTETADRDGCRRLTGVAGDTEIGPGGCNAPGDSGASFAAHSREKRPWAMIAVGCRWGAAGRFERDRKRRAGAHMQQFRRDVDLHRLAGRDQAERGRLAALRDQPKLHRALVGGQQRRRHR